MSKEKKVAVLGFDCAEPHLMEKHIAEGHLPNFKKLIQGGVIADNCLCPFPTITPPNWATIATGANVGTHQVTDFHVHKEGGIRNFLNTAEAFSSDRVKAEYIWDAADKAGKKCIVLNYPGSWPSHMKNGIVVGGSGLSVGEHRDGFLMLDSRVSLCSNQVISTEFYPRGVRGKFEPAEAWSNLTGPGEDPLEMAAHMEFTDGNEDVAPTTWYVLARQSGDAGYDTITLSPARDMAQAFFTVGPGEWSPKIVATFKMKDGSEKEGFFRCKLMVLADDASECTIFLTSIVATRGWSSPAEVASRIESPEGVPVFSGGLVEYSIGSIDLDTYNEVNEIHDLWLGDAAVCLLKDQDWDLFYMHSHPPDWAYHVILNDMDPNTQPDAEKRARAWAAHLRIYQSQDRMLGRIMEAAGKDTLFVLVSDHGAVADGPMFNVNEPLMAAGLLTRIPPEEAKKELAKLAHTDVPYVWKYLQKIGVEDMGKTVATLQGQCHIYINLKGRDPMGIVDPEDYEKIQLQIIDVLYAWVDPETKKRPISLALTKADARLLGLYGENCGDVVFAVYPWFSSQHGPILPTAQWGVGSLKVLMVMSGPGVKKGVRLERTMWLQDVVPTVCYLNDLPMPNDVDGAVVWQLLKDPNMKQKELAKLESGKKRMNAALERKGRAPWDKHDCA